MPAIGLEGGRINIVPVDYVVVRCVAPWAARWCWSPAAPPASGWPPPTGSRKPATTLICGRDQDKLDEACREAGAKGYEFLADPADLSDMADADRFVQQLLADHGGVDVLIWTRCAASEYQAGIHFLTAEPVSRRFMGG